MAAAEDVTVRIETGGQEWVSRRFPVEIVLSRPVPYSEGRVAVFLDKTDLTDFFERTDEGFRYLP